MIIHVLLLESQPINKETINIEMENIEHRVCVTGGASYVGSMLIKKLLEKQYTVHATLRSLEDESKVGLLKNLPGADTKLKLFQADIYSPQQFEEAINGCLTVFHVATPLQHTENSQYKDTVEATVDGVRSIAMSCIKSGTVKRLIYTATVFSASPLKEDGNGFKDSMDESCWTPLHLTVPYSDKFTKAYIDSKTEAEKEILKFGRSLDDSSETGQCRPMEIVTLCCGLTGGEGVLPYASESIKLMVSQLTGDPVPYQTLRYSEEYTRKIRIVHLHDVCDAHIFCMEKTDAMNGRFLCANSYIQYVDLAHYLQQNYPQFHVKKEYLDGPRTNIKWGTTKLIETGFKYKYDMMTTVDDSVKFVSRLGLIRST